MSLLPDVLSVRRGADPDVVLLDIRVQDELDYFRGHFPGLPILPGVVQIDWAMRFAAEHLGAIPAQFAGMKALKFTSPIRPGALLTLELRARPESQRVDFAYVSAEKKHSSGQFMLNREA
jgi:3-hydroxymyristoyl/3-hydroxydecanoyl-(acyl carrier protein) dehydratase